MRRRLALATISAFAAVGAMVAGSAPASAALNVNWNWPTGFLGNLTKSDVAPPGANVAGCKSPGKLPLILVHGTWEHQADNWQAMSPYFKNAGYCVYTFNYGGNKGDVFFGYKAISNNAAELKVFVDQVLAQSGAKKVNIVGHSQGGVMPRYYIKFLGGMGKVDKFVGLASSNNGTTLSGVADLGKALGILPAVSTIQPAAIDQTIGSTFMKTVNSCPSGASYNVCKGDTTTYTVLQTNGDQIVTPPTGAFLSKEPGATASVTNIMVNNECFLELAEHLGMTYSQNVASRALRALDGTTKATCKLSLPYLGG